MSIQKSPRHQKIIGQFGEHLVCNRLSCSGFDVMLVDHIGIDLIANREDVGSLGISVKSRTRGRAGTDGVSVNLFSADDRKLEQVCKRWSLQPWIAVYVETANYGDLYLASLAHYRTLARDTKMLVWDMGDKRKSAYLQDPDVKHFHIDLTYNNWFGDFVSEP